MTRLWTCGYETGDVAESGVSTIGANAAIAVATSTPTPRGGSYCLKLYVPSSSTFNSTYKTFALGAAKTDVWVRWAIYEHAVHTTESTIVVFQDSAAANQASVSWSPADQLLRAYRANQTTLLATSSTTMSADAWHCVEVRWQATSATVGIMEVWLDGTRVINFSGDTVNTANVNVQSVLIGQITGTSGATGSYVAVDDIAINDTAGTRNNGQVNDGRIVLLSPNGAGSNTGLTRGGTDTGANWSQTSESPPSMTQYVYGATAALRDTYTLGDLPVTPSSVSAAEVVVLAQNSDAGAGSIGLTVKSSTTTNEGSAQSLGTTANYYKQLYETDPNTSAAWTAAALNALEAGVTVR